MLNVVVQHVFLFDQIENVDKILTSIFYTLSFLDEFALKLMSIVILLKHDKC